MLEPLIALSSVDGRYRATTEPLAAHLSEYALIKARVRVECEYLIALSQSGCGMRVLTEAEIVSIHGIAEAFSLDDARAVKEIEQTTKHDVKSVEYFLKKQLEGTSLSDVLEWIHFALTSEDVNSVSHALLLAEARDAVMLPALARIQTVLDGIANTEANTPMLARTHGQPASPTTFGKEMRVFERRLARQMDELKARSLMAKFGGATGNWNAHSVAAPGVDWQAFARLFVSSFRGLELNDCTTQIEPHDTYAELFDTLRRTNTILIGFSQDMWRYISDGWVTQKPKDGEVGSSAMPHKVNPIDFENAEGNFGVANALFEHFSRKLPISRLQRDLSDSTVERVFGTAFAHSLIGYEALLRGMGKVSVNHTALAEALAAHPEVLAEAIQTVLRAEGVAMPYEQLKALTRGKQVTMQDISAFIEALDVRADVKARLHALTPGNYVGIAPVLSVRRI